MKKINNNVNKQMNIYNQHVGNYGRNKQKYKPISKHFNR